MDDATHQATSRQNAWKAYWATGNLHSCVTSYDGNYSGAIARFWTDAFRESIPFVQVLDLATGNGAIPKLLHDLKGATVQIDAVDASPVNPHWLDAAASHHIRFHSGVWMEHLPFPDASFDLVCSQFGIEYAERPAAWHEAFRVLNPGGRLLCVVHHRKSVLADIAAQEQDHCAWLLDQNGLLTAALRLAPWLLLVRRGELTPEAVAAAESARASFNTVQAALAVRIAQGGTTDLLLQARSDVQAILGHAKDPVHALHQYAQQLRDAELRCSELVQCAMSHAELTELADALVARRPGARLDIHELTQAEGLLAWGLTLSGA